MANKKSHKDIAPVVQNVQIVEPQWTCRACGNNEYTVVGDGVSTDYSGTLPDGRAYKRVDRQLIKCTCCSQASVKMNHVMQE